MGAVQVTANAVLILVKITFVPTVGTIFGDQFRAVFQSPPAELVQKVCAGAVAHAASSKPLSDNRGRILVFSIVSWGWVDGFGANTVLSV
jgi:hypothetical protein